jgi:GNAT superfamily N-acetyltransferase
VKSGEGEQLAGEARYVADPDGVSCDFGVVVADAWRKSGIAGLLMEALICAACTLGFEVRNMADDLTTVNIVKVL